MRSNKVETNHKPTDTDNLALDTLKWIYEAYVDKWCHGMRWEGNTVSGGGLDVHINDEVLLWSDDGRWRHSPSKCHYAAKPGLNTGHAGILVTIRGVLTHRRMALSHPTICYLFVPPDCGTGSDKSGPSIATSLHYKVNVKMERLVSQWYQPQPVSTVQALMYQNIWANTEISRGQSDKLTNTNLSQAPKIVF